MCPIHLTVGVRAVTALDRRWHRFDVEYRLPSDLPASIKARDGRLIYTASASVTIVRALSRAAPASWSASVQCWSPDVHFAVNGTRTFVVESAPSRPMHNQRDSWKGSWKTPPSLNSRISNCSPSLRLSVQNVAFSSFHYVSF